MKSLSPSVKRWKAHIEQWKKSNLSQNDYCQLHKLHPGTFSAYKARLIKQGLLGPKKDRLSELTDPFILLEEKTSSQFFIELPNKVKICFDRMPDPAWVGKVLGEINATS
jgi:hypothetical protein